MILDQIRLNLAKPAQRHSLFRPFHVVKTEPVKVKVLSVQSGTSSYLVFLALKVFEIQPCFPHPKLNWQVLLVTETE